MAIPAGLIARKFGYKGGILVGLVADCCRRVLVHSCHPHRRLLGLSSRLVYHCRGHDMLGNHCQSLHHGAGFSGKWRDPHQHSADINGGGWILGPIVGGHFVFSGSEESNANAGLYTPYWASGYSWPSCSSSSPCPRCPICAPRMKSRKSGEQKVSLKPSTGQLAAIGFTLVIVCGLLYFFISPILGSGLDLA